MQKSRILPTRSPSLLVLVRWIKVLLSKNIYSKFLLGPTYLRISVPRYHELTIQWYLVHIHKGILSKRRSKAVNTSNILLKKTSKKHESFHAWIHKLHDNCSQRKVRFIDYEEWKLWEVIFSSFRNRLCLSFLKGTLNVVVHALLQTTISINSMKFFTFPMIIRELQWSHSC